MQESHGQSIFTCLGKDGASYWQDQLPNQHTLAWHYCGRQMLACQKQWHVWLTPSSQILQLHKIQLISADILGGVCICLQQILSTPSLAEAPFSSCTATLDPVLTLFFFTDKLEGDGNIAYNGSESGLFRILPHRHFFGGSCLSITRNSAFTDWDYLRSRIILSHSAVNSPANLSDTFQVEIRVEHLHTIA